MSGYDGCLPIAGSPRRNGRRILDHCQRIVLSDQKALHLAGQISTRLSIASIQNALISPDYLNRYYMMLLGRAGGGAQLRHRWQTAHNTKYITKLNVAGEGKYMTIQVFDEIRKLNFGSAQASGRITVVPLEGVLPGPVYMTMSQALKRERLEITELEGGASVPELVARNEAAVHVLILDGEELVGAMQNRVLNTSVLLAPNSATRIPVSCTESGRWRGQGRVFTDSDEVMPFTMRSRMKERVFESLRYGRRDAGQSQVWGDIDTMMRDYRTSSPTSAMKDATRQYRESLDESIQSFQTSENQVGACIFIDGRMAGMELVSTTVAFQLLWPKLIRSYAMDSRRLSRRESARKGSPTERSQQLVEEVSTAKWEEFDGVGSGRDLRLGAERASGSALVFGGDIVQMSVTNSSISA